MNALPFDFAGERLSALPSGALHWPEHRLLCVSDLHLGKSERTARRGGALLPPYEGHETLDRLAGDIAETTPETVICLGDSFDDALVAETLEPEILSALNVLMAGRDWIWIEGNHEAGPVPLPGRQSASLALGALTFRHMATEGAAGEVSGHYHPKARLMTRGGAISRRCFLRDQNRLIMPAYGAFTGGLDCTDPVLADLMGPEAVSILLGTPPIMAPMPRQPRLDHAPAAALSRGRLHR